jgi:hypothetical protein
LFLPNKLQAYLPHIVFNHISPTVCTILS